MKWFQLFYFVLLLCWANNAQIINASICQQLNLWPLPNLCNIANQTDYILSQDTFSINLTTPTSISQISLSRINNAIQRYKELLWIKVNFFTRGLLEPHLFLPHPLNESNNMEGTDNKLNTETNTKFAIPMDFAKDDDEVERLDSLDIIILTTHDNDGFKKLTSDESYTLNITAKTAKLVANTIWGAMYGLDVFSQVITYVPPSNDQSESYLIRGGPIYISDYPRFPWRGVLLDTANHYSTISTIYTLLDAMFYNRFNVFHWHIVDSYSFPMQTTQFPALYQKGAWNSQLIYSTNDMKAITDYAADRGIRIVIEIDVPSHGYSWGLGYSNLTAQCPENIYTTDIGSINIVPLNPVYDFTYEVVNSVLNDVLNIFPDHFLHLGGDELQYDCWLYTQSIVDYMKAHNMTVYDLQAYFEQNTINTLKNAIPPRTPLVWEETFQSIPSVLPSGPATKGGTIVEVWDDSSVLDDALNAGFDAILSLGWYLDRQNPVDGLSTWFWGDSAWEMYLVDQVRLPNASGTLLGGEANMWSEQVSPLNIQERMWPRASAVAERLWSPKETIQMGYAAQRLGYHRCRMSYRGIRVGPIWSDYCGADYVDSSSFSTCSDTTNVPMSPGALGGVIVGSLFMGMCILYIFLKWSAIHNESSSPSSRPLISASR